MPRQTYRKIIVTDELVEQINPKNIKLMKQFLKEKNTRSSDLTIKNYESDLKIFFTWVLLYADNEFFVDIKKLTLAEFFGYAVSELKWGSSRFSRVKSCLSSLSTFIERLMDDEYPNFKNVVLKAIESMPKNASREKTVISDAQFNFLLEELSKQGETQILCWVSLAAASGARFSELLRITTDLIDENSVAFGGLFLETTETIKTKGRSKSGKMLKKYILKDIFLPKYNAWMIERNAIMAEKNKEHNSIFINENGDPASEQLIRMWIKKIESILGVPTYPHMFRHFFTTFLVRSGLPSDLVQVIGGWSSSNMVDLYSDIDIKEREFKELDNLRKMLNK